MNWTDYFVDVLAGSPAEINGIEARLEKPSAELVKWVAGRWNRPPDEMRSNVTDVVAFKPVTNLFYLHPSVNKARRFKNSFKGWRGIVDSHLLEVSVEFPTAVFLLQYCDLQSGISGKTVIFDGNEVRHIHDIQHAQGLDWALLDIFAPYEAEWNEGLPCGSLWDEWVADVIAAANVLKSGTPNQQPTEPSKEAV